MGGRPDLVEVRWARIGVPEAKQPYSSKPFKLLRIILAMLERKVPGKVQSSGKTCKSLKQKPEFTNFTKLVTDLQFSTSQGYKINTNTNIKQNIHTQKSNPNFEANESLQHCPRNLYFWEQQYNPTGWHYESMPIGEPGKLSFDICGLSILACP